MTTKYRQEKPKLRELFDFEITFAVMHFCAEKTVDVSEIRTRFVRVVGEHTEHLITTTTQNFFYSLSFYFLPLFPFLDT